MIISDLPDGATIDGAMETADGDYVVSGDLSQPVTVNLGDNFEGNADISLSGVDASGNAVPEASETVTIQVDDQFAMDSSTSDQADNNLADNLDNGSGDWTSDDGGAGTSDIPDFNDDSNLGDFDQNQGGQDDDYSNYGDIV